MNKVNTIEVLWQVDKDELLANKFTGAVRIMKSEKVYNLGRKPSYKRKLLKVEYYKNGIFQTEKYKE